MSDNKYSLDERYTDALYVQLEQFQVELDEDPLLYSPQRLNEKLANVTNFLSSCMTLSTNLSKKNLEITKYYLQKKTEYQLDYNDILANDIEVKSQKSMKDRKALAQYKLKDSFKEISEIENALAEYEIINQVIKGKMSSLKDIQSKLQQQIKIMELDIDINKKVWQYRDREVIEIKKSPGKVGATDHLNSLLSSLDKTIHEAEREEKDQNLPKNNEKDKEDLNHFFRLKI